MFSKKKIIIFTFFCLLIIFVIFHDLFHEGFYQLKWHYKWRIVEAMQEQAPVSVNNILSLTKGYAQGGIVVGGVAYLAADQSNSIASFAKPADYPFAASFQAGTLIPVKEYGFEDTYDSTPLIMTSSDGKKLLIMHEYKQQRSKAIDLETGETEWVSDANQPGHSFFGFSYYIRKNESDLILVEADNGLHAISLDTGQTVWWLEREGGATPAVDQKQGIIYFQSRGRLDKINASTGQVIVSKKIHSYTKIYSTATVLINDANGYNVATYWYGRPLYRSSLKIFDADLNLKWEKEKLAGGPKTTISYGNGRIYLGSGDFSYPYSQNDSKWKHIRAYDVKTGKIIWTRRLSSYAYDDIPNVIYVNEFIIAETQSRRYSNHLIFVLNASDGSILQFLDTGSPASSCAPPLFSGGRLLTGNLFTDSFVVVELGLGEIVDWRGAFGDPQLHHMAADSKALTKLYDSPKIMRD